jgi:hypothetical protein
MSGTSAARRPWPANGPPLHTRWRRKSKRDVAAAGRRVGMNVYFIRDIEYEIRESLRPVLHLNGYWNKLCLNNAMTYGSFSN